MLNFLRRFFNQGSFEQKSFLSAEQACAIAESAVMGTVWAGMMSMSEKRRDDNGKLLWLIGSASVGSGMTVIIDDAASKVVRCEKWGVR